MSTVSYDGSCWVERCRTLEKQNTALVEALEACLILEYTKEIAPHLPGNLMPMIKAALRQAKGGA